MQLSYAQAKSEVEVVDLVLTLREKIKSLEGQESKESQRHELTLLVKSIVKLLPPDLHSVLNKT